MTKTCPYQEICLHFKADGKKPPNHDIRNKYPCNQWLKMDCGKIDALMELEEFASGLPVACDINKIKRIKGELKG